MGKYGIDGCMMDHHKGLMVILDGDEPAVDISMELFMAKID